MKIIILFLLLISIKGVSQDKTIAFSVTSKTYNTHELNLNGVAVKSITIVGHEAEVRNALFVEGSKYLSNWIRKCNYMLLSVKDIVKEYPLIQYKAFEVEKGKVYLLVKSPKEFNAIFKSFSKGDIPPPTPTENTNSNKKYRHIDFCQPETDLCVTVCLKKKPEISFEICCDDLCFEIKFDGELTAVVLKELWE